MPHVVIVNAVYPPEPVVSAQMGRDLAVHLVGIGAQVTVLCPPPSRPLGGDYAALQPVGQPLVRVEEGIEVVRLCSFTSPQSRLLPRMWESWSFGRKVCHYLEHHLANADVVYANTWPMVSQALLARYCVRSGTPLVWHIKDLYPESLLAKVPGCVSKSVAAPLVSLDRWIADQAQKTVVLSGSLRRVYLDDRGLRTEKVLTVQDWVDEQRFARLPERSEACARYDVPEDRFTFFYLGNIGAAAGVALLVEAFHAARLPHAQLVIAGDGSAKAACVERARSLGTREVRFISDPEANNVPLLQTLGHVCLLPLRKGAGMSSIPSKLMAYFLSAKPVLATVDAESDTATAISEAQCGWIGEPENVQGLAEDMRDVAAVPATELEKIGQRGRSYGLAHYSKQAGVGKLADVIVQAARHVDVPLSCRTLA